MNIESPRRPGLIIIPALFILLLIVSALQLPLATAKEDNITNEEQREHDHGMIEPAMIEGIETVQQDNDHHKQQYHGKRTVHNTSPRLIRQTALVGRQDLTLIKVFFIKKNPTCPALILQGIATVLLLTQKIPGLTTGRYHYSFIRTKVLLVTHSRPAVEIMIKISGINR